MSNSIAIKEFTEIFMADTDVTNVYCIESEREQLTKDMLSNTITLSNGQYLFSWGYCKGIVCVNFCKA